MADKSIVLEKVSKVYTVSKASDGITLLQAFRRRPGSTYENKIKNIAVNDVSLTIKQGERVGIIGHNGAGKTTLLQIIAGLAAPSSGSVIVQGHVNCVMTLGIGLREALSGRENIYIDGELNGKLRSEIDTVIDKIIEFADLGKFIDLPVRTYSSGMKARLAFSMIVFIEPEILIIDEALSAGDAKFSAKASTKMKELCAKGDILIIVSHSMAAIVEMCDRCLWLDHGRLVMDDIPEKVTKAYVDAVRKTEEEKIRTRFQQRSRRCVTQQVSPWTPLSCILKEHLSRALFLWWGKKSLLHSPFTRRR
jgi:lipopolysaccharide transport system ATP-binding protein